MHLALQNLIQDRLRLALSVLGVALAVMLVLFMLGLRAGFFNQTTAYLDHASGTVTVMPEGVRSTASGFPQLLRPETVEAIISSPGVANAVPVLFVVTVPEWHGTREAVRLIGYEPARGGGPWSLAAGREPQTSNEVVLDRSLADRHGFRVGDHFEFGGYEFVVAGLSNETSSLLGAYVFAQKALVESLMLAPGAASLVLIEPSPGVTAEQVIADLRAIPGTNPLLKSEVMANDRRIMANILDQVIFLMVGAAFIVGALVVGMVIYTATIERQSEYGVLKALGASNRRVYRILMWQALVAASLGVLAGVALASAAGWFVTTLRPQFPVDIEATAIAATLAGGLVMALLGALAPARSVARLAPADVFRR